ncbi:hypothetical protein [Streptomyces sp. TE33382]
MEQNGTIRSGTPAPARVMGRTRRPAAWGSAAALLGCLLAAAPLPGTAPSAHAAAATLTVTSPDLFFVKGQAKITLTSDQTSVTWKAVDDQGPDRRLRHSAGDGRHRHGGRHRSGQRLLHAHGDRRHHDPHGELRRGDRAGRP